LRCCAWRGCSPAWPAARSRGHTPGRDALGGPGFGLGQGHAVHDVLVVAQEHAELLPERGVAHHRHPTVDDVHGGPPGSEERGGDVPQERVRLLAGEGVRDRHGDDGKPVDVDCELRHGATSHPRQGRTLRRRVSRAPGMQRNPGLRPPRPAGQSSVPVTGSLSANNSEALRDAALTGLGIALLPDFSAQASLQAGKLVQVLPQWKPVGAFAEQLYAIRPYSPHVPRAVTVFVAYLREAFSGGFGEGIEPPSDRLG